MLDITKILFINGAAISFSLFPDVEVNIVIQVLRIIALLVAVCYSGWKFWRDINK